MKRASGAHRADVRPSSEPNAAIRCRGGRPARPCVAEGGTRSHTSRVFERISHVALKVPDVVEAEHYYTRLFDLRVAFRDLSVGGEQFYLRPGLTWTDARAKGFEPGLSALARDGFVLALEQSEDRGGGSKLDHIGIEVDESDLDSLAGRLTGEACVVEVHRTGLLVFSDRYGVRWECSAVRRRIEDSSTGARTGRWLPAEPPPGGQTPAP